MLSNRGSNACQKPTHTVLEESKGKGDALTDDLLQNSINIGISASLHLF